MLFYPALERPCASALVGVRAWACTACVASGASPALLACLAPAAVPRAGLHSWGEPGGRAAAWCTSPYPPFFSSPPVSSRWAPLSDSTCNYTVTFLHLLLQTSPLPPKSSSQPRNSVCVCALNTMNKLSHLTQKHAWSKDANAHTAYQHFGKCSLSSWKIFPNFIPVP